MLATVPAHPLLWGEHDIALHHRRRYRKKEFEALFDPAKWIERRMTYIFAGIFAPAAAVRLLRRAGRGEASADTRRAGPLVNGIMKGWHRLEAAWLERFDAPVGLSLLTVREKRAQGGRAGAEPS